ncbi:MAG: hypothetical protein SFU56_22345 [Capsulimonadales bacterium]|nr:hypothetical protein [Capsulimonadales bacterium]
MPLSSFVQKEFAIGFWVEPPFDRRAEARYREIKEAGFNLVLAGFSGAEPTALVRVLRRTGLNAIVTAKGDVFTDWPDDPVVLGYSLRDEPGAADFPALKTRVEAVRRERPGRLGYINLFPNYASPAQLGAPTYEEYVRRFLDEVRPDVLSMDHYPIFLPDRDGRDRYCENLATMREHSLRARVPFWNFFNSMPYGPHTDPTEAQLRWQVFASLCYGAKGVLYFCYFTPRGDEFPKGGAIIATDGTKTRHYAHAQRINALLKAYGPTLMRTTTTGVYRVGPTDRPADLLKGSGIVDLKSAPVDPPGDYLVGSFRHQSGRRAVLLMNYRFAFSAWPTVVFDAPVEAVREVDPTTGRAVPVRDDSPDMPGLQISLADGEGRLFLLP